MTGKLRVIFGDTIRSVRRVLLEVLAMFFVALAVLGIGSIVEEYRKYSGAPEDGIWRLGMSALFASVMLIFALHTFWKARKLR